MAEIPKFVIVGGFLGAGKTTLILKSAELLRQKGKRVGIILNDQDSGLVDTRHAIARELIAREVAGGCFCCRFSELISMARELRACEPDFIFAEPVGSCIDLNATVIRPIQTIYHDEFTLAPLTVLLDPTVAQNLHAEPGNTDAAYLLTNQLAEADLVCITKQDLTPHPQTLPMPVDFHLSAKTGLGVEDWLDAALNSKRVVGARLLQPDYLRYAEAEAALGWLNLHAALTFAVPKTPALVCGPLLDELQSSLTAADISIAHLKVFDRTPGGWIKASVCSNADEPVPEGNLIAEPDGSHELALNVRAFGDPDDLRKLVSAALDSLNGTVDIRHLSAFRPPPPKPEHRMS